MPVVEVSIVIGASKEELFALTQDYDRRLEWDPFVREIAFLHGAVEAAPGVQVWVKAKNGLTMTVEYVTVMPPRRVAIKMLAGPRFFERFAGAWTFNELPDGDTEVCFQYNFRIAWKGVGRLLERAVIWVFRRDIKARLNGLKRYVDDRVS